MGKREDGGPAFPEGNGYAGMTLRQWYKGMDNSEPAWTISECAFLLGIEVSEYKPSIHWPKLIAKWRGILADALIAEDNEATK